MPTPSPTSERNHRRGTPSLQVAREASSNPTEILLVCTRSACAICINRDCCECSIWNTRGAASRLLFNRSLAKTPLSRQTNPEIHWSIQTARFLFCKHCAASMGSQNTEGAHRVDLVLLRRGVCEQRWSGHGRNVARRVRKIRGALKSSRACNGGALDRLRSSYLGPAVVSVSDSENPRRIPGPMERYV